MGDMRIGALLGKDMSFDVGSALPTPEPWSYVSAQASTFLVTGVHSSRAGLDVWADSKSTQFVLANNCYSEYIAIRNPLATAWAFRTWVWAKSLANPSKPQVEFNVNLGVTSTFVSIQSDSLSRYEISQGFYTNAQITEVTMAIQRSSTNSLGHIQIDNILPQMDRLILHPEWDVSVQEQLVRQEHRTMSGQYRSYKWSSFESVKIPLQYLITSEADLLNWWWQKQVNVALTFDSSDYTSTMLYRIVNDQQPIGSRIGPYPDMWKGTLDLAGINNRGLVF